LPCQLDLALACNEFYRDNEKKANRNEIELRQLIDKQAAIMQAISQRFLDLGIEYLNEVPVTSLSSDSEDGEQDVTFVLDEV